MILLKFSANIHFFPFPFLYHFFRFFSTKHAQRNIPFDIQTEIIKRVLDVKSLLRFRSVSKLWKSFIDSSEFIAGYRAHKTHPHCLLLRYKDFFEVKYLSINSDTFKVQQDLAPNVSDLMKQKRPKLKTVIGYSHGLFCFYDDKRLLVLWNPSIRRSVGILGCVRCHDAFGFAVCPVTNEPTIVKILSPLKVEIFTLSSKNWTEIQCRIPRQSITFKRSQVVTGSCIYRLAYKKARPPDGNYTYRYMIVSFDLIAKEFKAIDVPDKILVPLPKTLYISKLKGSLVVIVPHREVKVWKMEPDCSFTHLFTINTPHPLKRDIVSFMRNGEQFVSTQVMGRQPGVIYVLDHALKFYDPRSDHISNLGVNGKVGSFFISSYKETLHLLDHEDSCLYPEFG